MKSLLKHTPISRTPKNLIVLKKFKTAKKLVEVMVLKKDLVESKLFFLLVNLYLIQKFSNILTNSTIFGEVPIL